MYSYCERNAKKRKEVKRKSVTGTSRSFMEQNSCHCSKREREMNSKRSEKGWQTEERRPTLSVCSYRNWERWCVEKQVEMGGEKGMGR